MNNLCLNIDVNLDKDIIESIIKISKRYDNIEKVILFGSRARKENSPKSDIDLAIYLNKNNTNIFDFIYDIENECPTLLEFDFSNMNNLRDEIFINEVKKDGVTIYEKY